VKPYFKVLTQPLSTTQGEPEKSGCQPDSLVVIYRLQVTGYRLLVTCYRLQVTCCRLQANKQKMFKFQADYEFFQWVEKIHNTP